MQVTSASAFHANSMAHQSSQTSSKLKFFRLLPITTSQAASHL